MKILCFDIETTNLAADIGRVLCASWLELGSNKPKTASVLQYPSRHRRDPTDDKLVVKATAKALSKADIIVSWYGSGFDFPFLQTRLLIHGMQPMPPIPHIDLWRTARYQLKFRSNRLVVVEEILDRAYQKTKLIGSIWTRAAAGHRKSIKYVIDHCEADVLVLSKAYEVMRPLVKAHPNLAVITENFTVCPRCGGGPLHHRGFQVTPCSKSQRYQCQKCGGWCHGRPIRLKVEAR